METLQQAQAAQHLPSQADLAQQPQGQAPLQGSPEQRRQNRDHNRDRNRFTPDALKAKRDAAIAALREERDVAAPEAHAAPQMLSAPPPAAVPQAILPPGTTPGMDPKVILEQFDAKIRQEMALKAEIEAKEKAAAEKVAKLEQAKGDPLQFLAEAGITDDEWQAMLRGGGELSPEQKRIKELEAKIEGISKSLEQKEAEARQREAHAQAQALLQKNPLARKMATPQAIIEKQAELSKNQGRQVSHEEALNALTDIYKRGVMNLLQDPEIRDMFNLSVPKPMSNSAAVKTPTTLGSKLASTTTPGSGKPGPTDWKAKRDMYLQLLAQQSRQS